MTTPAHQAAERALLGTAMLPDVAVAEVLDAIELDDLELPRHRTIYSAIAAAHADAGDAAPLAVLAILEKRHRAAEVGGASVLLDLADEAAQLAGRERIGEHARIVRDAAERRRVAAAIAEAHTAAERGADAAELRARLARVTQPPAPAADGLFRDWAEVAEDPPVRWLADGLLPEQGIVVVAGAPNAGKSLLVLDAALRAAHGQDWFGRRVRPTSTLYCAGEGAAGYAARLRAWRAAHPAARLIDGHTVAIVDGVPNLAAGAGPLRAAVEAFRAQHGRLPGLVVVDTWAAGATGVDENDASAVGAVLRALAELVGLGLCVVAIHHARKLVEGQRQGGQSDVRGSTAITGAADVVLLATEHDDARTLRCAKSRDGERAAPIRYLVIGQPTGRSRDDGTPEYGPLVVPAAEAPATAPERSDDDRLVDAVRRLDGTPTTRDALATAAGMRATRGRAAIDLAIAAGTILAREVAGRRTVYSLPADRPDPCAAVPPNPPDGGTAEPSAAPTVPDGAGRRGTAGRREGVRA